METVVHIGEVKLGLPGHTMSALLGSCIGIALFDRRTGRCTLSHSLLPTAPEHEPDNRGRWVDQAVRYALVLLDSYPNKSLKIEAAVAGGGNMMQALANPKIQVGSANAKMAQDVLKRHNISISTLDVLGDFGRRMTLVVDSLDVQIETIPRIHSRRTRNG